MNFSVTGLIILRLARTNVRLGSFNLPLAHVIIVKVGYKYR